MESLKNRIECDLLVGKAVAYAQDGLYSNVVRCLRDIRDLNHNYMYYLAEYEKPLYWLLVSAEWGSYQDVKKCLKHIEKSRFSTDFFGKI